MTLTRSKVKVKVTGLLNFRQLAKPCMLAAMTAAPFRGFLVNFPSSNVLNVRWVMKYGFCSNFHTLSSSATSLKIGYDLKKLGLQFKGGKLRHSVHCLICIISDRLINRLLSNSAVNVWTCAVGIWYVVKINEVTREIWIFKPIFLLDWIPVHCTLKNKCQNIQLPHSAPLSQRQTHRKPIALCEPLVVGN